MQKIFSLALLFIALSIPAFAQTLPAMADQNSRIVGSFTVETLLPPTDARPRSGDLYFATVTDKPIKVQHEVVVWNTPANQTFYSIKTETIWITSDEGDLIDSVPTPILFNRLTGSTVRRGAQLGFTAPAADCSAPVTTSSHRPLAVQRTGHGLNTHFTACDPAQTRRDDYSVCTPNGPQSPVITWLQSLPAMPPVPPAGCQATWN